MDDAVRSPQLTATTMRFPDVLLAAKGTAIVELAVSFVAPTDWTSAMAPVAVSGEARSASATSARITQIHS
jgi:hypothetical protein